MGGFLSRISYMLRNFASLPSLVYFSAISVSICAKLACSILMTDRNTATEPNSLKMLSKCRILSPKNTYMSNSHVKQQQHCSSASASSLDRSITSVWPMTARSTFSLSVRDVPVLDENGLTYCDNFAPNGSQIILVLPISNIFRNSDGVTPVGALNTGGV